MRSVCLNSRPGVSRFKVSDPTEGDFEMKKEGLRDIERCSSEKKWFKLSVNWVNLTLWSVSFMLVQVRRVASVLSTCDLSFLSLSLLHPQTPSHEILPAAYSVRLIFFFLLYCTKGLQKVSRGEGG